MKNTCPTDHIPPARSPARSLAGWTGPAPALAAALVICVILTASACNSGALDDVGQSCDPTPQGAGMCSTGVCARVPCTDSVEKTVCAGHLCSCGTDADSCLDQLCEDDQLCVRVADGWAYCLPETVCAGVHDQASAR